jgi:hypothetical protein|mmetsp:Transcript_3807/g.4181  ORF Transcript_3807/g.4181 Transcript_3807/m.4181 type:complete len:127 (+) Transcript_3807:176-556(+)|eukprot:gene6915-7459_t
MPRLWLVSACFGQKNVFESLISEGDQLFQKKEYQLALDKYQECLTLLDFGNPENQLTTAKIDKYVVPCLVGSAQCGIELKQYYKAQNYCKSLLSLRPNHNRGVKLSGICAVQLGDYKGAMKSISLK